MRNDEGKIRGQVVETFSTSRAVNGWKKFYGRLVQEQHWASGRSGATPGARPFRHGPGLSKFGVAEA